MLLIDVNVLVYAYREDAPNHTAYHSWLMDIVSSGEPFGVVDLALSGFLRIATHPKLLKPPSSLESALDFAPLRGQPNCIAATTDKVALGLNPTGEGQGRWDGTGEVRCLTWGFRIAK